MTSIARSTLLRHAFRALPRQPALHRLNATPASLAFRRPLGPSSMLLQRSRIAAFHASGRKSILPPPPQSIEGTINDPTPVPPTSPTHGSYHWTFERLVAGALVPLSVAPFIGGSFNPVLDAVFCGALLIHSHIGFDAMITDYFPKKRVPGLRALLDWTLRICTVLVAIAMYEFETNDVGVTAAVARIWKA